MSEFRTEPHTHPGADLPEPSLRTAGKNVAMLTSAHVGCRLLHLLLFAEVGRVHGVTALGGFAVATALGAIVLVLTDLGVSERIVREMAGRREHAAAHYAESLGFKLVAAGAVLMLFVALLGWLPLEPALARLCGLMVVGALIETFSHLNNAVFRAHERFELDALGAAAQAVTFVGLGLLLLTANLSLVWLGFAAIVGSLAELILSTVLLRRFVRPALEWRSAGVTLRRAAPYGITSVTALVAPNLDVLLLALVVAQAQVGEYASVARLLHGGGYLPLLAGSALLPTATIAWATVGARDFHRIVSDALKVAIVLGALAFVVLFVSAGPVMTGIYGEEFSRLQSLLKLGAVFILIKFPVACLSVALTASGRQAARAVSVLTGLLVTCVLIVGLASRYGVRGALGALIAGELVVLACQTLATRAWLAPVAQVGAP
jgi:O-antigen/teichoic acid export membrane protein